MYTTKQQKPQKSRVISHPTNQYVKQFQPWTRGLLNGHYTDVDWTTMSVDGTVVGTKMNAILGPEHLQGGPPKTNVQKYLMNNLPTTPTLPDPSKYIKGHLLNDNVGGPGEAYNLFPITAAANKEHERSIEHDVKDWVNEKKHWVKYNVEVTDINNQIISSQPTTDNFINCKLICHANVMEVKSDGKLYDSNRSVDATITSEYKKDSSSERKEGLGNFPSITDMDRQNYIPWLSSGNTKMKLDPHLFDFIEKLRRKKRLHLLYKLPNMGIGYTTIKHINSITNYNISHYHFLTKEQKRAINKLNRIGVAKLDLELRWILK